MPERMEEEDCIFTKSFFEVNMEDLINHSSTHYPDTTPLLEADVLEALDEELNVWRCYKCHKFFSKKCDLGLHIDEHLKIYILARPKYLPGIDVKTRNAVLDGQWIPINPPGITIPSLEDGRADLLKKIRERLVCMIIKDSLIQLQIDSIWRVVGVTSVKSKATANLHFSVCCLGAQSLKLILKELTHFDSLSEIDQNLPEIEDPVVEDPKIRLSADKTKLTVDMQMFTKDAASEQEKGTVYAVDEVELPKWLCKDHRYKQRKDAWDSCLPKWNEKMRNIFNDLDSLLKTLEEADQCKSKLDSVLRVCNEVSNIKHGHFEALLRRRGELEEAEDDSEDDISAINNLLFKTVQENYMALSYFDEGDKVVQKVAKRLEEETNVKLMEAEARVRGICYAIRELSDCLIENAHWHYHYIFIPLTKSFLLAQLKDLLVNDSEDPVIGTEPKLDSTKSSPEVTERPMT